jgi:hypothetical protein
MSPPPPKTLAKCSPKCCSTACGLWSDTPEWSRMHYGAPRPDATPAMDLTCWTHCLERPTCCRRSTTLTYFRTKVSASAATAFFTLPLTSLLAKRNSTNWRQPNKARWAQCLSTTTDNVAYVRPGLRCWTCLAFPTTCLAASKISCSRANHSTSGSKRLGDSKTNRLRKKQQKFVIAYDLFCRAAASHTPPKVIACEGTRRRNYKVVASSRWSLLPWQTLVKTLLSNTPHMKLWKHIM